MNTARQISELELHALVDGELSEEERAELEQILASAPAKLALARDLRDLNESIRARYAAELEKPLPPAMARQLDRLPRWPDALARRQAALAAALLLALAAGLGGYWAGTRGIGTQPAVNEPAFVLNAIGAHTVYLPEVRHPVEVRAAEEHLVRWLAKRVGAPVRAPALDASGWKLMGGRLLPDQGQAAAQFMYEDGRGRRFTLYIRRETGLANTAFRFVERGEFGAFYWIDRPLAYALAGRLSREELMVLAHTVYAQLEQR
jgi:anti-sigma factor RsiW